MTLQSQNNDRIALVIGATGGIGSETSVALGRHGWRVKALTRNPEVARVNPHLTGIDWIPGDAMRARDVISAAQGADLVVHAANPPKYRNWRALSLPMLANAIAGARASGARLVLPGNIYNFGPDAFPVITEASPQNPKTNKGAVRVEMEEMLVEAAKDGVRSMIVRAGDYFGSSQPASWLRDVMVKPGRPVRSVTYPGTHGVGHAWAYLPDVAETIARLADIEDSLPAFDSFNFAGHWFEDGADMARTIARVASVPDAPIRSLPWPLLTLASPFVPFFREILEMRYLWQVPVQLDNAKLLALLGSEPYTPIETALAETLGALGCLPQPKGEAALLA